MMLIICDKSPDKAVDYLIEHTDKRFVFKQLLELAQLVCSCGYSKIYKPVKQGKKLQEWIKQNKEWIAVYFVKLMTWSFLNIGASSLTFIKLQTIHKDLFLHCNYKYLPSFKFDEPKTVIFRYKKGYESKYETNSELPINIACKEYKKYLQWKFKESEV